MGLSDLIRRKSKSLLPRKESEWGIYLAFRGLNLRTKQLETNPYRASISTKLAENLLAQDPRLKFSGFLFGRWKGEEFEAGRQCMIEGSDDIIFESPDQLHRVRLKCGPQQKFELSGTDANAMDDPLFRSVIEDLRRGP